MRKLLLLLAATFPAFGLTTIQDTLLTANGGTCRGTIHATYPTFMSVSGQIIQGGSVDIPVTAGVINFSIEPGGYTVVYNLNNISCRQARETWIVPVSGSAVSLAAIRTLNPPVLPALIPLSFLAQSGAAIGQVPIWNGTNWVPGAGGGGGGGGDVFGPASASDGGLTTFNGTTGKAIKAFTTTAGILKVNASSVPSVAVSGTDYAPATSGAVPLKGNSGGGFSAALSADFIALFTGCTGVFYLGADGACHAVGTGDVSGGALSANGEMVVYNGTAGKTIKQSGLGAGIVKLNASAVPSIAASGTDYAPAPSGAVPLKGNGSGGFSASVAADIVGLFSGCTGTLSLSADGACHAAGSGSVTVVGAGNLTATAFMTGGGSQTAQTACVTCTMDSSGNISTTGNILSGVGSGVAGTVDMSAGTVPVVPSNSFGWGVPATMTTSVRLQSPNSVPSANNVMLFGAPSSNIATWAWTGVSGTGFFAMTTSPSFTNPTLGTVAAGSILTNATGLPVSTGISGLGTGVAAALGTAVSGSGAICLVTGSSCVGSGGPGGGTIVPKTANYTILSGDGGSIFTFNNTSLTATLTATVPSMPFIIGIKNLNASPLTVARNGNTINGVAGNLTLQQYQEISCESDTVTANNYVCTTPAVSSVFNSGTITIPAGTSAIVVCTSTCTVPVPVPVQGYQICVKNISGVSTVITLAALGSSAMYPLSDDSGYGTAGTGTMVSSAAAGNKVCLIGRDSTHYELGAVNASANWTVN